VAAAPGGTWGQEDNIKYLWGWKIAGHEVRGWGVRVADIMPGAESKRRKEKKKNNGLAG